MWLWIAENPNDESDDASHRLVAARSASEARLAAGWGDDATVYRLIVTEENADVVEPGIKMPVDQWAKLAEFDLQ